MKMRNANVLAGFGAIALLLIISGCTQLGGGNDPTAVAKALPEVQAFLAAHPNAEIKTSLWTNDTVAANIEQIRDNCGNPHMPIKSYWKVVAKEGATELIVWIDEATMKSVCIVKPAAGQQLNQTITNCSAVLAQLNAVEQNISKVCQVNSDCISKSYADSLTNAVKCFNKNDVGLEEYDRLFVVYRDPNNLCSISMGGAPYAYVSCECKNLVCTPLLLTGHREYSGTKYTMTVGETITQNGNTIKLLSIGLTSSASETKYTASFSVTRGTNTETASITEGSTHSFFSGSANISIENATSSMATVWIATAPFAPYTGTEYVMTVSQTITQDNYTIKLESIGASGGAYTATFTVTKRGSSQTTSINEGSTATFFSETANITVASVAYPTTATVWIATAPFAPYTGTQYVIASGGTVTQGNYSIKLETLGITGVKYAGTFTVSRGTQSETTSIPEGSTATFFSETANITVESVAYPTNATIWVSTAPYILPTYNLTCSGTGVYNLGQGVNITTSAGHTVSWTSMGQVGCIGGICYGVTYKVTKSGADQITTINNGSSSNFFSQTLNISVVNVQYPNRANTTIKC